MLLIDWTNVRHVQTRHGPFGFDDNIATVMQLARHGGPGLAVVGICRCPAAALALIVVIWILLYQQIENYLLSPRLTARTMDLSAPVALAAALMGGMLGGILFAFLALPVAGVIQAAVRAYGRYYEVVTEGAAVTPALAPERASQTARRARRAWIRRKK